jgi:hypothetical protein
MRDEDRLHLIEVIERELKYVKDLLEKSRAEEKKIDYPVIVGHLMGVLSASQFILEIESSKQK